MTLNIEEKFLLQVATISDKYNAIREATGSDYNIFSILGIENREIYICRVITDLLNPNGLHHQGNLYLELFAEKVLGLNHNEDDWNNTTVQTEYSTTKDRRIDIAIITPNKFIAIESKIYASEQKKQCEDYYNEAKASGKKPLLYYLTLNGTKPSDYSRGTVSLTDIKLISWKIHIIDWLEECLNQTQTQRIAPIREILLQLLSTVKKFTNQLEDRKMKEIKELLMGLENRHEVIKIINDAYEDILGEENRNKANQLRNLCKRIDEKVTVSRITNYVQDYDKLADKFFTSSNCYLGPIYPYKKINDKVSMYVLMELYQEGIAFGYALGRATDKGIERGQRDSFASEVSNDQIKTIVSPKEALLDAKEWWSAIEDYNGREKFLTKNFAKYFIETLLQDKDKMDNFIEDSAKQIEELLNKPST